MKRSSIMLGMAGMLLVSCASDGGEGGAGHTDGEGESGNITQVGPVSFELPDGIHEVYRDAEREGGWVAEYADEDQQSAGAFIGVWRFRETPPSAIDAAGEMIVQVRSSGTHPGIRTSEGGEVEISGAEDAYIVDLRSEDEAEGITGRWWVLVDPEQDVAVTVEFYGSEVSDEDVQSFAETLEMDAGQSW
ncbi:hypothetical protein [Nesterenkonia muleiensis]|uniref:hypothetical protein n=1 Tax=Nesterenkonia muleiensis TaxID=2282648 RepID=UPI000E71716A|nr:hypothetical protein [Nesterenkonia muleiensis]